MNKYEITKPTNLFATFIYVIAYIYLIITILGSMYIVTELSLGFAKSVTFILIVSSGSLVLFIIAKLISMLHDIRKINYDSQIELKKIVKILSNKE